MHLTRTRTVVVVCLLVLEFGACTFGRDHGQAPSPTVSTPTESFPGGGSILFSSAAGLRAAFPDGSTTTIARGFLGAEPFPGLQLFHSGELLAWTLTHEDDDYYVMHVDGSDRRHVLRPMGSKIPFGVQVSPDATKLAVKSASWRRSIGIVSDPRPARKRVRQVNSPRQSPDQLWRSILMSPLRVAYLHEVYALSHRVVSLAEDVFRAAPKPSSLDDFLQVDQGVMQNLFSTLGAAARLRTFVIDRPKRKSQDATEYAIQARRTEWMRDEVLGGVRLEKLLDNSVRNTLEHFDEYVDQSAIGFAQGSTPVPAIAPIDFVVSRRRALRRFALERKIPHLYFMRVFIASERIFVNCGHEISI